METVGALVRPALVAPLARVGPPLVTPGTVTMEDMMKVGKARPEGIGAPPLIAPQPLPTPKGKSESGTLSDMSDSTEVKTSNKTTMMNLRKKL